jgi:type II secretory ATPase GspE/PulE/Tfp pilus assembly ATPase PilB-like protein
LKAQIQRPNGMIITTGPTGSGKTTTLYAILLTLNTPDVKIITLEDPVEYKLEGIAQSQIDHTKDYTFAKGLRSILRQDPDVIMVGEIRDLETAETAIQAALTGHLLLSTIHTNDAAGAIPRFMSMGVKPFLLAPALNCIIGQRLCRTIHDKCKEETKLDDETLARVKKTLSDISPKSGVKVDIDKIKFFRGKGCDECNGIGYKGRIGIYEILAMSQDIEKVILSGNVSEYQMRDIAKAAGMITMAQDGILKALDGLTTVDEVYRVAE